MNSPPRNPVRAVLFDLDGVLVNTHDAEVDALLQVATRFGLPCDRAELSIAVRGRRLLDSVNWIFRDRQEGPPSGAVAEVRALAEARLKLQDVGMPGAVEALTGIAVPKYVVSNSPHDLIALRLAQAQLSREIRPPFFSAYDVGFWKPDPRLYGLALYRLGLDASEVLAVEDSEVGIHAAVGAGIQVLQFTGSSIEAEVAGAIQVASLQCINHFVNSR